MTNSEYKVTLKECDVQSTKTASKQIRECGAEAAKKTPASPPPPPSLPQPPPASTIDQSLHPPQTAPNGFIHFGPLLIVIWLRRIGQIKDDRRMGLGATPVGERAREVDRAIEMERAVGVDVDVKGLIVSRGVDKTNIASLHEVVSHNNVLLVRSDFDVVGANGGLDFVRVV